MSRILNASGLRSGEVLVERALIEMTFTYRHGNQLDSFTLPTSEVLDYISTDAVGMVVRATNMSSRLLDDQPPGLLGGEDVWHVTISLLRQFAIEKAWDSKKVFDELIQAIIRDMETRSNITGEEYGLPLRTFDGRDAVADAYLNSLDCLAQITKSIKEERLSVARAALVDVFKAQASCVSALRLAVAIKRGETWIEQ